MACTVHHPTTILLSFDGFRFDYLDPELTPNLWQIRTEGGLQAEYLQPCFPSVTFPNHYSIVTGLYPESHGIVANKFYDPALNSIFDYKDSESRNQAQWWGGEPIWATARKHGHVTAVNAWPGYYTDNPAHAPNYRPEYRRGVSSRAKIDQLLAWLDLPLDERPTFLASYDPDVDRAGHQFSPESTEVREALRRIDESVGYLQAGLAERHLADVVNVIYLSDHGMAAVPQTNIIYLDDYVHIPTVRYVYGHPLAEILPHSDGDVAALYEDLVIKSNKQPWTVYLKQDLPRHWHFADNDRIPPIVCVPDEGWVFFTRKSYPNSFLRKGTNDGVTGEHGYDNGLLSMRAIFLAQGPSFTKNHRLWGRPIQARYPERLGQDEASQLLPPLHPPFPNVEVYNLLCQLLAIPPAPNNGTWVWEAVSAHPGTPDLLES
ncbi:hypothetical protein H4R34_001717 [Dimargaris verticillata]|uniref:Alkaline-phosphatase-like protein n=1 Tax=Dimargaris verticillata TaxID=2761393 RepID=A0A9W8BA70_9FUNG|nr:hypothetical protein H4R34_001717 [Dimargaris verticillata]